MADQLLIEKRSGFGLASVMARKGIAAAQVGAALGIALDARPQVYTGGGLNLIGTDPDSWLALVEATGPDFVPNLKQRLSGLASVSDQSSGYTIFSLSGPSARTVLQRGAAIDFHDDAFGPGSAATMMIAHMGVIIWRSDRASDYQIALFRSYATSFRQWLDQTSASI